MNVDEQSAQGQSQKSQHGGRDYYFCSSECKQQFEKQPDRYARQSA